MSVKCPKCDTTVETPQGLKTHMSKAHKGWTVDDLRAAGVEPTARDHLRGMAGADSFAEARAAAPATEQSEEEKKASDAAKSPRKSSKREEAELEEKKRLAREKIGGIINKKLASMPYNMWAAMMNDDSIRLTKDELTEIVDAYNQLGEAYGLDYSGKIAALFAVLAVNGDAISKRFDKLGINFSGSPPAPDPGEGTVFDPGEPKVN